MITQCQCTKPGPCPTLGRDMVGRLWELCQTRDDYRAQFLGLADGSIVPTVIDGTEPAARITRGQCYHRPDVPADRSETCPLKWVFICEHPERGGTCRLEDCQACEQWEPD
jgi:formylglycine-generating enzyme required for sulfatase activity